VGGAIRILKRQFPSEVGTARRAVRGRLGEATLPKPFAPDAGLAMLCEREFHTHPPLTLRPGTRRLPSVSKGRGLNYE